MPNSIGKLYERSTQASLKWLFVSWLTSIILSRETDLRQLVRSWRYFLKYQAEFCHIRSGSLKWKIVTIIGAGLQCAEVALHMNFHCNFTLRKNTCTLLQWMKQSKKSCIKIPAQSSSKLCSQIETLCNNLSEALFFQSSSSSLVPTWNCHSLCFSGCF